MPLRNDMESAQALSILRGAAASTSTRDFFSRRAWQRVCARGVHAQRCPRGGLTARVRVRRAARARSLWLELTRSLQSAQHRSRRAHPMANAGDDVAWRRIWRGAEQQQRSGRGVAPRPRPQARADPPPLHTTRTPNLIILHNKTTRTPHTSQGPTHSVWVSGRKVVRCVQIYLVVSGMVWDRSGPLGTARDGSGRLGMARDVWDRSGSLGIAPSGLLGTW